MKLLIIGAGKLGKNFRAALNESTHREASAIQVSLRADRRGLPKQSDAEVVLLAVRDGRVAPLAAELAATPWGAKLNAAIHASGALSASALDALRGVGVPVAQLHPMLSFASERQHLKLGAVADPRFSGGHALVAGDARAVRVASRIARVVGLKPRHWEGIDPGLYHAAAALVANGAAALASVGAEVLRAAGVPEDRAPDVLGPLLGSVAFNVSHFGLPGALTGPVRRGGTAVIASHLAGLNRALPEAADLYRAVALAQLPLAERLGDASIKDLQQIAALLRSAHTGSSGASRRGAKPRKRDTSVRS
ncbi:MAG: DUF2520 domain-containing protein [Polyangiaceae bacterium]|nr:DUF2520 domain-containing protein [Polyangiaceae bacterium]